MTKSVKENLYSYYYSTPIFYPNANPHLGHAFVATIVDIIVRYKKMKGYRVYFQTGSDDHGEKIEKKAAEMNISPQQLIDKKILTFKSLWKELSIDYDNFYRTSSEEHKKKVQKIFQELLNKKDIYLGEYLGKYCIPCEDYISNSKVVDENFCPCCQAKLREIKESAYFFRVSKYYLQIIDYYKQNPNFLLPDNAKKELFSNFLKENIPDLCVTRSDIKWGIPVPNDDKTIIYVWFEALCNYINSQEGGKAFDNSQTKIVHVIGKEIVRFHAIYWPAILLALKKKLPTQIISHSWIITPEGKMSKSKGNITDPLLLLKNYPKDLLRTYFVAKINLFKDGVFSEDLLKELHQIFYVNSLGNLYSRVNKMIEKYQNSMIPVFKKSANSELSSYYQFCLIAIEEFQQKMDNYQLIEAWQIIEKLVDLSNKLISKMVPWNLFKGGQTELLEQTLNYLVNGIKIIALLLKPIAPDFSKIILNQLNTGEEDHDLISIKNFHFMDNKKIKKLENPLFNSYI